METILERLSSYNIFNNIIPGAVFCFFCKEYLKFDISGEGSIYNVCLFYFWGLLMSRIGSLLIESFSKTVRFVKYSSYPDYLFASNKNESIKMHLEVNNMFRSVAAVFLCLSILEMIAFFNKSLTIHIDLSFDFNQALMLFFSLAFIVMMFAYRKQTSYIVKKVKFEINQSSISEG